MATRPRAASPPGLGLQRLTDDLLDQKLNHLLDNIGLIIITNGCIQTYGGLVLGPNLASSKCNIAMSAAATTLNTLEGKNAMMYAYTISIPHAYMLILG